MDDPIEVIYQFIDEQGIVVGFPETLEEKCLALVGFADTLLEDCEKAEADNARLRAALEAVRNIAIALPPDYMTILEIHRWRMNELNLIASKSLQALDRQP